MGATKTQTHPVSGKPLGEVFGKPLGLVGSGVYLEQVFLTSSLPVSAVKFIQGESYYKWSHCERSGVHVAVLLQAPMGAARTQIHFVSWKPPGKCLGILWVACAVEFPWNEFLLQVVSL